MVVCNSAVLYMTMGTSAILAFENGGRAVIAKSLSPPGRCRCAAPSLHDYTLARTRVSPTRASLIGRPSTVHSITSLPNGVWWPSHGAKA
eukprot:6480183-Amphidinium_carterae.1